LKKKGSDNIREDDRFFERNENQFLRKGIGFCLVEIFHKNLQPSMEKQKEFYTKIMAFVNED